MSNMMSSICSFLVIFSVIYNVHSSVKRTTCNERTELTSEQIQAALDAHNHHRSQASDAADMRKLVWSDRMASRAQNYANLCRGPGPSPCDPNGETGQNLYILSGRPTVSPANISAMVQEWANEKQYYNFTIGNCSVAGGCDNYKQLVWAKTFEVGCGIKLCNLHADPLVNQPSSANWIFVCYYNPAGNTDDQKPYQQGLPCSVCRSQGHRMTGSWCCKNNPCVPE